MSVRHVASARLPTQWATFEIRVYGDDNGVEHLALSLGAFDETSVLTRVHSECLTGDGLFSLRCDCGFQLEASMEEIAKNGTGLLIYLRQEGRGIGLTNKIRAYALQDQGADTVEANQRLGFAPDLRSYQAAVDILQDFGVGKIRLMTNNPRKVEDLTERGIEVTERVPIAYGRNAHNDTYLSTKASKMGHVFSPADKKTS